MTNETNRNDGVYLQHRRAVVVRLLSFGAKYKTKEGYLRDEREHDSDVFGVEYEIEVWTAATGPARLWLAGNERCLGGFNLGDVVAIGWQSEGDFYKPTAWRLDECYTPLS